MDCPLPCDQDVDVCRQEGCSKIDSCQKHLKDSVKSEILTTNQLRQFQTWRTFTPKTLKPTPRHPSPATLSSNQTKMEEPPKRQRLHHFRGAREKDDTPKSFTFPSFPAKISPKPVTPNDTKRARSKSKSKSKMRKLPSHPLIVQKGPKKIGKTAKSLLKRGREDKESLKGRAIKSSRDSGTKFKYSKKDSTATSSSSKGPQSTSGTTDADGSTRSDSRTIISSSQNSNAPLKMSAVSKRSTRSSSSKSQKNKNSTSSRGRSTSKGANRKLSKNSKTSRSNSKSSSRAGSRSRSSRRKSSSSRRQSRGRSKRKLSGRRKPRGPPPTPISRIFSLSEKIARLERFNTKLKSDLELSRVDDLRGYCSEPELKTLLISRLALQKSSSISNFMSHDMTAPIKMNERECYDEEDFKEINLNENIWNKWNNLFSVEKHRFSFFDQLYSKKYVTDSMEVPKSLEDICYLIDADDEHYQSNQVDYARLVLKTKNIYTGNLVNWNFQGPGRYVWLDGSVYQGDFVHGVMHGAGTLIWPNGSIYEGQFSHGYRFGWGIYTTCKGYTYAGQWVEGYPHGRGKIWYSPIKKPNQFYDGEFSKGRIEGVGMRQYGNGKYFGSWSKGQRHGNGTMIWKQERQMYKGQWSEGQVHGEGLHVWYSPFKIEPTKLANEPWYIPKGQLKGQVKTEGETVPVPVRHIFKGQYKNGVRHGLGKIIYANGAIYQGTWEDGRQTKEGIFLDPNDLDQSVCPISTGTINQGQGQIDRPSYECLFNKLINILHQIKPIKSLNPLMTEERQLTNICFKYLNELQLLYARARNLGDKWSNHTMESKWRKNNCQLKFNGDYEVFLTTNHKMGPPTRFGLWLMMRDCPGLFRDVTMTHYDTKWESIDSIGFQNGHNPYELVQFWQFLQCLIVTSFELYVEIPSRKIEYKSDFPPKATSPVEVGKEKGAEIIINQNPAKRFSQSAKSSTETSSNSNLTNLKPANPKAHKKSSKVNNPKIANNPKDKVKVAKLDKDNKNIKNVLQVNLSDDDFIDIPKDDDGSLARPPSRLIEVEKQTETEPVELERKSSSESDIFREKSDPEVTLADIFERFITLNLLPCFQREAGKLLPKVPNPLPPLVDLYRTFKLISNGKHVITAIDFLRSALQGPCQNFKCGNFHWKRCHEGLSTLTNYDQLFNDLKQLENFNGEELSLLIDNQSNENVENLEQLKDQIEVEMENVPEVEEGIEQVKIVYCGAKHVPSGSKIVKLNELDELKKQKLYDEEEIPFLETELMSKYPNQLKSVIKENKYKWSNLESRDIIKILGHMYSHLCGVEGETNLNFELIFCDWLWCVCLCSENSNQKEEKRFKNSSSFPHQNIFDDTQNPKFNFNCGQCNYRGGHMKYFRDNILPVFLKHEEIRRGEFMYGSDPNPNPNPSQLYTGKSGLNNLDEKSN